MQHTRGNLGKDWTFTTEMTRMVIAVWKIIRTLNGQAIRLSAHFIFTFFSTPPNPMLQSYSQLCTDHILEAPLISTSPRGPKSSLQIFILTYCFIPLITNNKHSQGTQRPLWIRDKRDISKHNKDILQQAHSQH